MAFITPLAVPATRAPLASLSTSRGAPRMSVADASAPPESRVAAHYPLSTRHEAPVLNFHRIEEAEAQNMVGLTMEEVSLDLDAAAAIRGSVNAPFLDECCGFLPRNFADVFTSECEDAKATNAVDRYFPKARRNEIPVLEFSGDTSNQDSCGVNVQLGHAVVDPEADDAPVPGAESGEKGLPAAVQRAFGERNRSWAPDISFEGKLGFTVGMTKVTGEPHKGLYDSEKFKNCAPEIQIRREAFPGDINAYVVVGSEEVPLKMNGY